MNLFLFLIATFIDFYVLTIFQPPARLEVGSGFLERRTMGQTITATFSQPTTMLRRCFCSQRPSHIVTVWVLIQTTSLSCSQWIA